MVLIAMAPVFRRNFLLLVMVLYFFSFVWEKKILSKLDQNFIWHDPAFQNQTTRIPSQCFDGTGGFQRRSPKGGWANGIPLNIFTYESVPAMPEIIPDSITTLSEVTGMLVVFSCRGLQVAAKRKSRDNLYMAGQLNSRRLKDVNQAYQGKILPGRLQFTDIFCRNQGCAFFFNKHVRIKCK